MNFQRPMLVILTVAGLFVAIASSQNVSTNALLDKTNLADQKVRQDTVLGDVPNSHDATMTNVAVWVVCHGDTHSTREFVETALQWLRRTEKGIEINRLRANVFIRQGQSGLGVEVLLTQGIGKPCWTIKLDGKLSILGTSKGTTRA